MNEFEHFDHEDMYDPWFESAEEAENWEPEDES